MLAAFAVTACYCTHTHVRYTTKMLQQTEVPTQRGTFLRASCFGPPVITISPSCGSFSFAESWRPQLPYGLGWRLGCKPPRHLETRVHHRMPEQVHQRITPVLSAYLLTTSCIQKSVLTPLRGTVEPGLGPASSTCRLRPFASRADFLLSSASQAGTHECQTCTQRKKGGI